MDSVEEIEAHVTSASFPTDIQTLDCAHPKHFLMASSAVQIVFYLKYIPHSFSFPEPSIIHVVLLNRTMRILFALSSFCLLLPIVDYIYFYSTKIAEYQIDDSGICSHYPIYQVPCGEEVSDFTSLSLGSLTIV